MSLTAHQRFIVGQLVAHMWTCRRQKVSFADCMAEARVIFNKEVREEVDRTPLPTK